MPALETAVPDLANIYSLSDELADAWDAGPDTRATRAREGAGGCLRGFVWGIVFEIVLLAPICGAIYYMLHRH